MEGVIIIIEEEIIEIKIPLEIEVDHLKDRTEMEETIEMPVIVD